MLDCVFKCCALLYYDYNLRSSISIHFCMCCRFLYLYLRYNHIQDVDSDLFQQIIYVFLIVQISLYLCNERVQYQIFQGQLPRRTYVFFYAVSNLRNLLYLIDDY